jgi:D-serine deaminase-like pyridoxal phosphate-dependent protein
MRPTPYVQVDARIVDANVNSMQEFCDSRGIALRPHAKTHKSVDVARRQLVAGATGLTVATVGEGEVFANLLAAGEVRRSRRSERVLSLDLDRRLQLPTPRGM